MRASIQLSSSFSEEILTSLRQDSFFMSDKLALQIEEVAQTKSDAPNIEAFQQLHQAIVKEWTLERSKLLLDQKHRDMISSFKVIHFIKKVL